MGGLHSVLGYSRGAGELLELQLISFSFARARAERWRRQKKLRPAGLTT